MRRTNTLALKGFLVAFTVAALWDGMGKECARSGEPTQPAVIAGNAQKPNASTNFKRLWPAVLRFRNQCAMQGNVGWKQFGSPKVQQRLELLNPKIWDEVAADDGWSYFFSLALFDIGHPTAKTPVVGFYHPWSDFWALTQWQVDPEPKIVDVELISGEWMRRRGKIPFDLRPDWLRREGFRAEQLAKATVENIREFDKLMSGKQPWFKALQLSEQKSLLEKVNYPAVSIQLLEALLKADELAVGDPEQPALQQVVSATQSFLKIGQAGKIAPVIDAATRTEPDTAKLIRSLPAKVFGHLAPVYWLADKQRAAAFLVPKTNPDFCLILTYERDPLSVRLVRIDIVYFPGVFEASRKKEAK